MNAVLCVATFCEKHGPRIVLTTQAVERDDLSSLHMALVAAKEETTLSRTSSSPSSTTNNTTCASCASIEADAFLVSYDEETAAHYVSTASPQQSEYKALHEIALRSLTHEQCPGMEGPILFGAEDADGYAVAHMFKVLDRKARGGCRVYSLILVVPDEAHLVATWPFVTRNFETIVAKLKAKSKLVFDLEGADSELRPVRSRFARQRMAVVQRSLTELVGMEELFPFLHAQLAWVLKGCGRRFFQVRIEGSPASTTPTRPQDHSSAQGGASSSSSLYGPVGLSSESSLLAASSSTAPTPSSSSALPSPSLPSPLIDGGGGDVGCQYDLGWVTPDPGGADDLEAEQEDNDAAGHEGSVFAVESLSDLGSVLDQGSLACVVYHTVVGNQVVVRGPVRELVEGVLDVLASLLPSVSVTREYAEEYLDSWRCNFLGLAQTARIPAYVDANTFVLVDISTAVLHPLHPSDIRVQVVGSYKETTLGRALVFAAIELERALVAQYVHAAKVEWHNKAKGFYKYAKMYGLHDESSVRSFLRAFNLSDEDVLVLRFWGSGMGRHKGR